MAHTKFIPLSVPSVKRSISAGAYPEATNIGLHDLTNSWTTSYVSFLTTREKEHGAFTDFHILSHQSPDHL